MQADEDIIAELKSQLKEARDRVAKLEAQLRPYLEIPPIPIPENASNEEKLKIIMRNQFELDEATPIDLTRSYVEWYNADEVDLVNLWWDFEKVFHVKISTNDAFQMKTPQQTLKIIAKLQSEQTTEAAIQES